MIVQLVHTIITVDDEPEIGSMYKRLLEGPHIKVIPMTCPMKVVASLDKENPPDLLIVDLNMPCMSGDKLVRLVRANQSIPVVIVSGSDHQPVQALNIRYFTKPLAEKIPEFLTLIYSLLDISL